MDMAIAAQSQPLQTAQATKPIDLSEVKDRQQLAWSCGDYAVIGTTLQLVGELLAEACDPRYVERVLDVAAGNGNAMLAAARRGCRVTSTDYVSALLNRGAERAAAERLDVASQVGDAEALPFEDGSFDAAPAGFVGPMFTVLGRHIPSAAGLNPLSL
jgi:SAM-dependent methyltransferase